MSMLELSHVKKSFKENPVIRDISISVEQGDVVAVLGPSGSGKHLLSYLICCFTSMVPKKPELSAASRVIAFL